MVFVIFVAGLVEYDSGKTTLSKEIMRQLKEQGMIVEPFKPLSGNNLYYHYSKIKEIFDEQKEILSLDIMELLKETGEERKEPDINNPVHRLNTPAIAYEFMKEGFIQTYFERFAESIPLVQRFTIVEEEKRNNYYIINKQSYKNEKFFNNEEIIEELRKKAKKINEYSTEEEYMALNMDYYAKATETTFEKIMKKTSKERKEKTIIIEGFNNAAHPAWCVRKANVVIVTGPGTIMIYEPKRYFEALDNYRMIKREKMTKTSEIVKIQKPEKMCRFEPEKEKFKEEVEKVVEEVKKKMKE